MTFLSHAQNFEDVLLWRALKAVERGFYIDIGAQDPMIDSVSRAFYEAGWRGIHVEATPSYAAKLRADRPDELVIEAAIGAQAGILTFYEIPETGLSTGDRQIADMHRQKGFQPREIAVPCITLSDLFDRVGDRPVHWLKIDVEGMEEQVLSGWGNHSQRPWILVIESTIPGTEVQTQQGWERTLCSLDYKEAFFDGLNRYFVSAEHSELIGNLKVPANVFDMFAVSGRASNMLCSHIDERHSEKLAELGAKFQQIEQLREEEKKRGEVALSEAAERYCDREEEHAALAHNHRARISVLTQTVRLQRRELALLVGTIAKAQAVHELALAAEKRQVAVLEQKISANTTKQDELGRKLAKLRDQHATMRQHADRLENIVWAVQSTTAWRIGRKMGLFTQPLASIGRYMSVSQETIEEEAGMERIELPYDDGHPVALSDFDDLHDADFVYQAYRHILMRDPDPMGQSHYLTRIRAGYAKSEVLLDLAKSREGKAIDRKIIGKTRYKIVTFIKNIPVLGRIFEGILFMLCAREFTREVRALENYTYRLKVHLKKLQGE
jgi:FkbM family methyltransferase